MKSETKEMKVKMIDRTPGRKVTGSTFRNEHMNVRVPFEIPAKSMKDTDETRSEVFSFVHIEEHTEDDIPDGLKKDIQARSVIKEKATEFFRYGKDAMPVRTGDKFKGHM